jgi:hypothetical protein
VAVTVKVAVEAVTVGVPVIAPVLTSNTNPEDSVGEIPNVRVPSPPVATTGVNDVTALNTVNLTDAVVTVVTIATGGLTVK